MRWTDPPRVAEPGPRTSRRDEESAEWLRQLRSSGRDRDEGLRRLHELMVRSAWREVRRRSADERIAGPELDDVAHQAAADAMVAVLKKLDGFRGESRFTTWAYAFVMFEVSTKLGQHFRRVHRVRLDGDLNSEAWERMPDRLAADPVDVAEGRDLLEALRRAVAQSLTAHQRRVFVALAIENVPLEAVVDALGTNRNAVYKTMFDARRKIRAALVADGHLNDDASGRQ